MFARLMMIALLLSLVPAAGAQTSPAPATAASPRAQNSAAGETQETGEEPVIAVQLTRSLDAKKLKAGDPVRFKITAELRASNGTVIPAGSFVQGHIVEASARSKGGQQSSIAIAFDKIAAKGGQEMPLKATIQAVAAPPEMEPQAYGGQPGMSPSAAPGMPNVGNPGAAPNPMGGTTPMGGTPNGGAFPQAPPPSDQTNSGQSSGPQGDTPATPILTSHSTGVIGLRNIELQPNSTLVSTGKDLKLDSGTEMLLRVQSR
jgi:hypothetical protein